MYYHGNYLKRLHHRPNWPVISLLVILLLGATLFFIGVQTASNFQEVPDKSFYMLPEPSTQIQPLGGELKTI